MFKLNNIRNFTEVNPMNYMFNLRVRAAELSLGSLVKPPSNAYQRAHFYLYGHLSPVDGRLTHSQLRSLKLDSVKIQTKQTIISVDREDPLPLN